MAVLHPAGLVNQPVTGSLARGNFGAIRDPKILLYYKFTPIADPEAIRLWQHTLCESLGLKGRILISSHGINGTVGGPLDAVKTYRRRTREFPAFKDIDFKWSEGTGDDFPRLRVRVRDEIVTFGRPDEIKVNEDGIIGGGQHLKPEEVNNLVESRRDDVVFFDGRNAFEAGIGRFRGAVVPLTETTPDFVAEIESGKYDHLKDKAVITYCTGGVRCEVLSALMKNRGFNEVYQIDGGIVRYTDKYGDRSLWEGSLYVFDNRLKIDFSPDPVVLGNCEHCGTSTNRFHNCSESDCRRRILLCGVCSADPAMVRCAAPAHGTA
jgi:UPF0176 protein